MPVCNDRRQGIGDAVASVRGLRYAYPGNAVPSLACSELIIEKGEFFSLIGPSGCGKTTLLRLLAGLLPAPSVGTLEFPLRVSMVFQEPALLPWRTCVANVGLPAELRPGVSPEEVREEAHRLLALVGLSGVAGRYPHQLSGGQKQRVAIARALNGHPDLLLMDEPFSALDEVSRRTLNDELVRIWRESGATIVFVTHNIAEAAYLSSRVGCIEGIPGVFTGSVEVPFSRPRHLLRHSAEFARFEMELRRRVSSL